MMVMQSPLAQDNAIWPLRLKILLATLVLIIFEQVFFAYQFGVFDDAGSRWLWSFFLIRISALLFVCVLLYGLLELVDRVHLFAAVATLVAAFIPLAVLHSFIIREVAIAMGLEVGPPGTLILAADYWVPFMLVWGAGVLATFYHVRLRSEQRLRLEATASAHRARMRTVRYRLNPHFLFNTLNSIGLLALEREGAQATALIDRLAAFLRATLQSDPAGFHALSREFEQLADYLAIEQIRFPDRLSCDLHLPRDLENAAVPPFILQPLVENAIRHSVSSESSRSMINVEAQRDESGLALSMSLSNPDNRTDYTKAPSGQEWAQVVQENLPPGHTISSHRSGSMLVITVHAPLIMMGPDHGEEARAPAPARAAGD